VIYALNCLGRAVRMRGQAGRAVLFHTESLELLGEVRERRSLVYTHLYLGDAHLDRGEHGPAAHNLAAAARTTSLGDPGAVACCLERSAALLAGIDTRADSAAVRLCAAAAGLREQRQVRIAPSDASRHAATTDLLRGRLGGGRFDAAWRDGEEISPSEALEMAASLLTARIADQAPAAATPTAHRVLTTVLVTDMVGSTDLAATTDADTWTQLIERHQELTRKELARHGGREVRATGDGVVALFDHPAAAVGCALALVDTLAAAAGITIRAGVHTGEYDTGDTGAAGSAVRIADKVAAAGRTGGVMVSSTVRALLSGGPLRLAELDVAPPEGTSAVYAVTAPESDDEVSGRGHSAA
jgi:class 3 adenylate cyclase